DAHRALDAAGWDGGRPRRRPCPLRDAHRGGGLRRRGRATPRARPRAARRGLRRVRPRRVYHRPGRQRGRALDVGGPRMNRLADETSPYLLQHAENPVDWFPWGEEALERARAEDKPILLSIGYAACHWCHVMAHESFENAEAAALMNEHFVNIKVDREERPDLDSIYMRAVQTMTGQGGWPMTMFLFPDGTPFYGGTYFPPEDRQGMPSFRRILRSVAAAYEGQQEQLRQSSERLIEVLRGADDVPAAAPDQVDAGALEQCY